MFHYRGLNPQFQGQRASFTSWATVFVALGYESQEDGCVSSQSEKVLHDLQAKKKEENKALSFMRKVPRPS